MSFDKRALHGLMGSDAIAYPYLLRAGDGAAWGLGGVQRPSFAGHQPWCLNHGASTTPPRPRCLDHAVGGRSRASRTIRTASYQLQQTVVDNASYLASRERERERLQRHAANQGPPAESRTACGVMPCGVCLPCLSAASRSRVGAVRSHSGAVPRAAQVLRAPPATD